MLYARDYDFCSFKYILDNLRDADRIEAETLGKHWKKELIKINDSMKEKPKIGCTVKGDIPVLVWGLQAAKNNPSTALVWMLSTPLIEKHKMSFLRQMKDVVKKFDDKYDITFNKIYKENYFCKTWLKKAGYRFPAELNELNELDKSFLSVPVPQNFEMFYRLNPIVYRQDD